MEIKFEVPFTCDSPQIEPYLQKVFHGEYDLRIGFPVGTRIIDLGANCGAFSVWATHRWPGCIVYAYEPNPKTFEILKLNVAHLPQIATHNHGIGSPGLRVLHHGGYNSGECSFHHITNNPVPTGEHLTVLDPMTLPEADIIKLDIEGCEVEVLEPLIKTGRKFDLIMLEWHNHELRKQVDALLTNDYELVGCEVQHIGGRGVSKYLHKDIAGQL